MVERTFADLYCNGNLPVARTTLLLKQNKESDWWTLWLGLRLGVLLVLLCWVLWDCIVDAVVVRPVPFDFFNEGVFRVYRGIGCLILAVWLWGINIYVWTSVRINFRYLFEMDADAVQGHAPIFMRATSLTLFFLINFLLFFKITRRDMGVSPKYRQYAPLVLTISTLLYMFWPATGKRVYVRGILRALSAPFSEVTFFSVFIADVMTSMVKVFSDLAYTACYFGSGEWNALALIANGTEEDGILPNADELSKLDGYCANNRVLEKVVIPIICILPLWLRLMQNLRRYKDTHKRFPFLANALKYAAAQSVVVFSLFNPSLTKTAAKMDAQRVFWIFCFASSTLYTYAWDVRMDWGLCRRKNRAHGFFLRTRRMYVLPSFLSSFIHLFIQSSVSAAPTAAPICFDSVSSCVFVSSPTPPSPICLLVDLTFLSFHLPFSRHPSVCV